MNEIMVKTSWKKRRSKQRRVVIFSRTFRPEPTAAALRLGALADALTKEGARVHVLTSKLAEGVNDLSSDTLPYTVSRAPVLRDETGMVRGYLPYMSFDLPGFIRLLTVPRPDVVVCEPPPTSGLVVRVVCGIRRVPYVYYAGDLVSDAARAQGTAGPVVSTVQAMERWVLRGARRVITVGKGIADRISELSGQDADVVLNGIDTSGTVGAVNVDVPAGFPQTQGPVFLYAGTVADWLSPEVFVDAFKQIHREVPDARLVFLGQGSAWQSLQESAKGIPGVLFKDAVSPDVAKAWYAHADVSLASLKPGAYEYAYPTKILASLAAGTPVIYAGPGDAACDIEENALGLVCEVEAAAVAQAMLTMVEHLRSPDMYTPERLWAWVDQNRSVRESSGKAARIVLDAVSSK